MRDLSVLIRPSGFYHRVVNSEAVFVFGKKYKLTGTKSLVLAALLDGKTLRQIFNETGRACGTVRWHVQNNLEKWQVKTQKNLLSAFYRLINRQNQINGWCHVLY